MSNTTKICIIRIKDKDLFRIFKNLKNPRIFNEFNLKPNIVELYHKNLVIFSSPYIKILREFSPVTLATWLISSGVKNAEYLSENGFREYIIDSFVETFNVFVPVINLINTIPISRVIIVKNAIFTKHIPGNLEKPTLARMGANKVDAKLILIKGTIKVQQKHKKLSGICKITGIEWKKLATFLFVGHVGEIVRDGDGQVIFIKQSTNC